MVIEDRASVGVITYLLLTGYSPFHLALELEDPAQREFEVRFLTFVCTLSAFFLGERLLKGDALGCFWTAEYLHKGTRLQRADCIPEVWNSDLSSSAKDFILSLIKPDAVRVSALLFAYKPSQFQGKQAKKWRFHCAFEAKRLSPSDALCHPFIVSSSSDFLRCGFRSRSVRKGVRSLLRGSAPRQRLKIPCSGLLWKTRNDV